MIFLTMIGGGSLAPARVAMSTAPQGVEKLGQPRPYRIPEARAGALDHQRLRMAVQAGDDDLLDRVEDLLVLLEHLLETRSHRADHAIGEQDTEERADQRRADHRAEDCRRFV